MQRLSLGLRPSASAPSTSVVVILCAMLFFPLASVRSVFDVSVCNMLIYRLYVYS